MMSNISITKEEIEWQKEADAQTLAEADIIKNDPNRLAGAKQAAKRMAEEETEKAKAMRKVAGKNSNEPRQKTASSGAKNPSFVGGMVPKRKDILNTFKRI